MNALRIKCLIVIVFLFAVEASAGGQVTIVVNTGPFASVGEAAGSEEKVNWWDGDLGDDRACTECFAAEQLAGFLVTCTGLKESDIAFSSTGGKPAKGDVFIIGSSKSNPLIESETGGLETDESFSIRAFVEKDRVVTIIEGRDRVGTLYGVYAYLNELGIDFYGLGEKGTVYPEKPGHLPRRLEIIENPSFLTRGFWAFEDRGNEEFFLWMARNRLNYWTAEEQEVFLLKKLGLKLVAGQHDIQIRFLNPHAEYPYNHPKYTGDEDKPADPYAVGAEYAGNVNRNGKLTYFEAHPEWYGLHDGKRSDKVTGTVGDDYCISNADATSELIKNLIQDLIDGQWRYADIVNFWMHDSDSWCECENCKKLGTETDRLLVLMDKVLKGITKARMEGRLQRNVELSSLAYGATISPPRRELPSDFDYENFSMTFFPSIRCYAHSLADERCTEVNCRICRDYRGWTSGFYKGAMVIGEYYNISVHKSLPAVFSGVMAADIPWYYRNGARHFHYMHTPTSLWGTWTLNQYLMSRLLWNHLTDADAVLDEYFRRYYPTTSQTARDYYRYLELAFKNIKAWKHGVLADDDVKRYYIWKILTSKADGEFRPLFPLRHLHYEEYHPATDDGVDIVEMVDYIRQGRKKIDAALMQCSDAKEQSRLLEDERRLGYGEAMIMFYYHIIRTEIFHRRGHAALARNEFRHLQQYAEILENITDLVNVASSHANSKDGLAATSAVRSYNFYKETYAGP